MVRNVVYYASYQIGPSSFQPRTIFTKLIVLFACIITIFIVVTHVEFPPRNYPRISSHMPLGKSNIYFVKTHKTGSSTVQNIIMRFGVSRDLDFALPEDGNHQISNYGIGERKGKDHKSIPPRKLVPPGHGSHTGYNISCFHGIFNETLAAKVVPAKDTVYVTILRDPVDAFESMYSYMKFDVEYNMSIGDFAVSDMLLIPNNFFLHRADNYMGLNQMLYDLGMDLHYLDDEVAVRNYTEYLERRFHLVMIQEYFDESIIFLRDLMGWNTDDVVYLKQNARDEKHKPRKMSDAAVDNIRALNSGDQILYEHFRNIFERAITSYGRARMNQEVQLLRQRLSDFQHACVEATVSSKNKALPKQFRPWSDMVSGFQLRPEARGNYTCEFLATAELPFVEQLRKVQIDRREQNAKVVS